MRKLPLAPRYRLPIIGLGVALALYLVSIYLWHRHDWVPLEQELQLEPSVQRTREFTTDQAIDYYIQIEIDPIPDLHTAKCRLGVPFLGERCAGIEPVIDVRWVLLRDGQKYLSGRSSRNDAWAWGRSSISRIIGTFQGASGDRYILDLEIARSASALARARPRIKVVGDLGSWEATVWEVQFLIICAFSYGAFNVIWIAVILIQRWRQPKAT
jgi:hypothetical protein